MKTLSEIKDQVAQDNFYADWEQIDMTENSECECNAIKVTMMDEVAKRYAEEAVNEVERRCVAHGMWSYCDKEIILNIIKELK